MEHDWLDLGLVREALSEEMSSTLKSKSSVDSCMNENLESSRENCKHHNPEHKGEG